jgi:hypothetical protein
MSELNTTSTTTSAKTGRPLHKSAASKPAKGKKTARRANAAANGTMNLMAAARLILRNRTNGLTAEEIMAEALRRKLWTPGKGLTPAASLAAQIYESIKHKGAKSDFVQVGPARFGLRK